MEALHYTVKIHEEAEGGFWAEVPALPGCFTQGNSWDEVIRNIKQAIECHLASLAKDGLAIPGEKKPKKGFAFPITVRVPRVA